MALLTSVGCVDGPLFHLKKLNPVIQSQWKKDRELGVVFSQRVEEMQLVKKRFPTMRDDEQAKWVKIIADTIADETSSEIRREGVQALAQVSQRPEALNAIMTLSNDKAEKVRLAVARGLRERPNLESTKTLLTMAKTDKSSNVKLAAIESLGSHRSDDVKEFLTQSLNDRSPGVQRYTAVALKELTGKDLGEDVSQWKRYMAGDPIENKSVSIAESIQSMLPFRR
jgi:HEAT repeat protein